MDKIISRLQFITYQGVEKSASQQTLEFCAGGGDWVQLRIKNKTQEEILSEAQKCVNICQTYGATLIINDNPELARSIDADGVHLGLNDMSIAEARNILGEHKIIGGTANTIEDVERLVSEGVDYIGLGPYKYTDTKKNLSPILGLEGYSKIISACNLKNIDIPIIAIGGIVNDEFEALFKTGIHGIALSSYIAKKDNIGETTLNALTEVGKAYSFSYVNQQ
ncbi:thiamine phosphate synthase [Labilibacter marinus]|uniref:thiamine phosphate synthase n=1 Tax=Labilibacter marinus TaxID=1477105 RepID=UPI00094FE3B2|nr:thiamine phosphate synthase [Labilibacter marinus]